MTSDFRAEVEILPSRSCAMHSAIIIGTVRSLIVDGAMGQIPRSTERISSFVSFPSRDRGCIHFNMNVQYIPICTDTHDIKNIYNL